MGIEHGPLKVRYPFVRSTYEESDYDEGGWTTTTVSCWKPGAVQSARHVYYGDDYAYEADGEGWQVLTFISRHKPGPRYPERVFYTQTWIDPDGKAFGKPKLRMTTARRFAQICSGYAFAYSIKAPQEVPA